MELIKESAFSDAQLLGYDAFWDAVRVENTIISDALKKGLTEGREKGLTEGRAEGLAEGRAEGLAEGRAEGRAEGEKKALLNTARQMKADRIASRGHCEIHPSDRGRNCFALISLHSIMDSD